MLFWEVHQDIARGMGFARKVNLHGIGLDVQCDLLLESQVGGLKVEAFHPWIFLERQRAFAGEVCADHDR